VTHDSRFLSRERPMREAGSPVPSRPAHLRQIPRIKGCLRPVVVDTGMWEYRDTRTLAHPLLPASLPAHPGIPTCPRQSLRGAGMPGRRDAGSPGCRECRDAARRDASGELRPRAGRRAERHSAFLTSGNQLGAGTRIPYFVRSPAALVALGGGAGRRYPGEIVGLIFEESPWDFGEGMAW
jgi:hypothetical protein